MAALTTLLKCTTNFDPARVRGGDGRPLLLPEDVPYLRKTRTILKVKAPNSARIPSSPTKGTELPVAGNMAGTGSGAAASGGGVEAAIMAELEETLGWGLGADLGVVR